MVVTGASQAVLVAHPQTPATLPATLVAEVRTVSAAVLRCEYVLQADLTRLALPAWRAGERRDELWRHTCFEAFVSAREESGYYEFNFSPSGDWAAYRFELPARHDTRALGQAPAVQVDARPAGWRCARRSSSVDWARPGAPADCGSRSRRPRGPAGRVVYWALAHPGQTRFPSPRGLYPGAART
jgi:hypothetical protein